MGHSYVFVSKRPAPKDAEIDLGPSYDLSGDSAFSLKLATMFKRRP